jgi:hypothetical protein
MAVASFEDLCAGFCDLVQVPPPALKRDDEGRVAFHVVLRGIIVNLVYCPETSPDHVFVIFELGPAGRDGPDPFEELRILLEANFVLLQVHPPVCSRNPATGDGVLQYVFPLFEATPHGLQELIDQGFDWVSHWRENPATQDRGSFYERPEASSLAMLNLA